MFGEGEGEGKQSIRVLEVIRDLMEVGLGVVPQSLGRPFNSIWFMFF